MKVSSGDIRTTGCCGLGIWPCRGGSDGGSSTAKMIRYSSLQGQAEDTRHRSASDELDPEAVPPSHICCQRLSTYSYDDGTVRHASYRTLLVVQENQYTATVPSHYSWTCAEATWLRRYFISKKPLTPAGVELLEACFGSIGKSVSM